MTLTYTYADVRSNFSEILEKARELHEVLIQAEDGVRFIIKLLPEKKPDYNLPPATLDLSRDEIVSFVRETRMRQ